jgi:SAM-dependent methyltransferase
MSDAPATPFHRADLYDLLFENLTFDVEFFRSVAREFGSPVLDLACGTGRILLRLAQEGFDVDGVDLFPTMLDRLRAKAASRGLSPNCYVGDLKQFKTPRTYGVVLCAFNAFAHNLSQQDQIASLQCARQHLRPGGVLACHMSYPVAGLWSEPDGIPILEAEMVHPEIPEKKVRIYDTRFKNPVEQTQRSNIEIQILDSSGTVLESHRSETAVRWIYKPEFELLLRTAGFSSWEIFGDFDRSPMGATSQQMLVVARA